MKLDVHNLKIAAAILYLFFSYFKIKINFTLLRTGPPYIKRNGKKRRETD